MSVPIYFINLADRPERQLFMERQFERLGLSAHRIDAAVGDATWHHPRLRPNQYACVLSHVAAWRALLLTDDLFALILEDDAILSNRLPAFLADLSVMPADIIKIETNPRPLTCTLPSGGAGDVHFRDFRSTGWGSAGYIISRDAAARLIEHPKLLSGPIDMTLFRRVRAPSSELRILQTDPGLCIQLGNTPEGRVHAAAASTIRPNPTRRRSLRHMLRLHYSVPQLMAKAWGRWGRRDLQRVVIPFAG